jgi:hypothetical protein
MGAQGPSGFSSYTRHRQSEPERALARRRRDHGGRPDRRDAKRRRYDPFHRSALTRDERLKLLRHWLVDDPQGWDESGLLGSMRYPPEALDLFTSPVVRERCLITRR